MKYIIVFIFIVNALFYTIQMEASDVESLPDAIVVKSVPKNAVVLPASPHTNKPDIDSLPDAIVVELTPTERKMDPKPRKKRRHSKHRHQVKKIDMNELPEATVVEVFDIDEYGNLIPRKKNDITSKCNTVVEETKPQSVSIVCATDSGEAVSEESIVSTQNVSCPVAAASSGDMVTRKPKCITETVVCETNVTAEMQKVDTPVEVENILQQKDRQQTPIVIVKTITDDQKTKEKIAFWELLDKTVQNSARLVLKKYDIALSEESIELIKNEYYPRLSLSYSGEYYHSFSKGDSADIGGSYYPSFSQYRDSVGLGMQYEVYRFGATDLKVKISQKELEIVRTELALQEEKVARELLQYFTQALKSQTSVKYKEKIRSIRDRILEKMHRLYKAGRLPKTSLMKSERALVVLEKEILQDRLNLGDAIKNIQILSNIALNPDEVEFLMFEPKNCKVKQFEESIQAKNLQLQIEVKKQEIALIEKDYYPTVSMNSGYRLYGSDENSFFKSVENMQRNSWDVGVTARWNMFDGYKTDHLVVKKKIELQQLEERYRLAKINFEAEEKRRELLKKTFDNILKTETKIIDQTTEQKEVYTRLKSAGKVDTLQSDYIEIDMLKNELSFRLNVIDRVYQTILSELIK